MRSRSSGCIVGSVLLLPQNPRQCFNIFRTLSSSAPAAVIPLRNSCELTSPTPLRPASVNNVSRGIKQSGPHGAPRVRRDEGKGTAVRRADRSCCGTGESPNSRPVSFAEFADEAPKRNWARRTFHNTAQRHCSPSTIAGRTFAVVAPE